MSAINPFSGYVAQGAQIERVQATEKVSQVRRAQTLSKNVAIRDDELEHQVESADAIVSIHDEDEDARQQSRQQPKEQPQGDEGEEPPHIDVTG